MITFVLESDVRDNCTVYILNDGTYDTTSAPIGKCKVGVRTSYLNPNPQLRQGEMKPQPPEYYVTLTGNPKTGKGYLPVPKKYEVVDESPLRHEVGVMATTYDIKLDEK